MQCQLQTLQLESGAANHDQIITSEVRDLMHDWHDSTGKNQWERIWLSHYVVKANTLHPYRQAGYGPPEGAKLSIL